MIPREMRWAVCGANADTDDFVTAVSTLSPTCNQKVVAVSHWELSVAKSFAERHGIEQYYHNCEDMFDEIDCDALYVGCCLSRRFSIISAALSRGISVLGSSPLALTARQTRQLVAQARAPDRSRQRPRLLLMEAVWARCVPAVASALDRVTRGDLGHVTGISCSLGCVSAAVATSGLQSQEKHDEGGEEEDVGATLSLAHHGIHLLRAISVCSGGQALTQPCVKAVASLNARGRDATISVSMCDSKDRVRERQSGGVSSQCIANMMFSNGARMNGVAVVCGTNKSIQLCAPFHLSPTLVDLSGGGDGDEEGESPPLSVSGTRESRRQIALAARQQLILHVTECLREGVSESSLVSLDDSLFCAELLDETRKQVGVVFAEDTFHCSQHTFFFDSQQPSITANHTE